MKTSRVKRLLKKSFYLIFILMGLIILGPFSFAQNHQDPHDSQNQGSSQEIQIQEDHDTKKLDKVFNDYNKDQKKVLKDAETIKHMDETGEISEKELGSEINSKNSRHKFFGAKKLDPKELKKVKYADAMRIALEPLQKMSEIELVKLLHENTKGSAAAVYIERYPKLAVFAVRLIKDGEALPNLAKIIDDEDKLIHFLGIMISTLLVAFFLKRLMKREGRTILKALGLWFLRFLIMTSLRLGILIYFYGKEIEPTFSIAKKTFF